MTLALLGSFLAAVNALTIFAFYSDKQRAVAGRRRLPEKDLLFLAMIGGSPGALYARQAFRHKTYKEPFGSQLRFICVTQIALGIGYFLI